jgi:hypothetical protein
MMMSGTHSRPALVVLAWLALCAGQPASGQATAPAAENEGPNAAVLRVTRGEYAYRKLDDGSPRGTERFELIAHPDGTRTLLAWNDLHARNGQINTVLRVDARFRPIEAHYTYWSEGKFKGSAYHRLEGNSLEGRIRTAGGGVARQRLQVPDAVSFATHPLAGDGWHTWYYDKAAGGEQPAALVNFDASADVGTPAIARLQPQAWRFERSESIEVPAGRFDAERYTGGGMTVWTTGPDRVLVRLEWTSLGLEYVLTQYATEGERATGTPAPAAANASVLRWAEGEYAYTTLDGSRDRGWERFRTTVHPDGSRSLMMWHGLRARSAQFTVLLRTTPAFEPLEGYVSYWNEGKFKGSASIFRDGHVLDLESHGAWGSLHERVPVDSPFSIGTHPIAGDGWHLWVESRGPGPARVFGLEAGADPGKPVRGELREMPFERIGAERISVPAGEFDTVHYRIAGRTDVWLHGEDRLMVRMRQAQSDREYVLTRYHGGP